MQSNADTTARWDQRFESVISSTKQSQPGSRKLSFFEGDTMPLCAPYEPISADRPVFQDASRSRRMSVHDVPPSISRNIGIKSENQQFARPHTRKILVLSMLLIVSVLLFLYYYLRNTEQDVITVDTRSGRYRGRKYKFQGIPFFSFLGIPFGRNTTGQNRFRRSRGFHYVGGEEVIDATRHKLPCTQAQIAAVFEPHNETTEDCLHLNLWTPSVPQPRHVQKTTLVFFYGIAFKWGSNSDYDASPLCALGDVIVVVPNYRLHALGFLGDGSDDAPGNVALYDQLLALDWVLQNIMFFGGNTSSVVLHGYEAGAVSIGYHMLSPVNTWAKTFTRLILQSGSFYRPYKRSTMPSKVMKMLGCERGGWPCLRAKDARTYSSRGMYKNYDFDVLFYSDYLPYSLPHLVNLYPLKGKQVLLGNVLDEGRFLVEMHKIEMGLRTDINAEPLVTLYAQKELKAVNVHDFESIRKLYANDSVWESDVGKEIAKDILGDFLFNCPVRYLASHLASQGSTAYVYIWTHKPSFGPWCLEEVGPTLYDDLAFVFGKPLLEESLATEEEITLSRSTIALFTDFAKTGTLPPVDGAPWPPYSCDSPLAVAITVKGLEKQATSVDKCSKLRQYIVRG
ncbi:acetylcholinesterase-like isoform X2 [Ornithodoros turicata]|uniref:acetylcholinesterase-like isoform X2 n=1 Tax=Ornithodoros turicata TaxID=34597 RepID=UPI003138652C